MFKEVYQKGSTVDLPPPGRLAADIFHIATIRWAIYEARFMHAAEGGSVLPSTGGLLWGFYCCQGGRNYPAEDRAEAKGVLGAWEETAKLLKVVRSDCAMQCRRSERSAQGLLECVADAGDYATALSCHNTLCQCYCAQAVIVGRLFLPLDNKLLLSLTCHCLWITCDHFGVTSSCPWLGCVSFGNLVKWVVFQGCCCMG